MKRVSAMKFKLKVVLVVRLSFESLCLGLLSAEILKFVDVNE